MARDYPALDLVWPTRPSDDYIEQLLAFVDDEGPTAVEDHGRGVRVFFGTPAARTRAAGVLSTQDRQLTCTALDVSDEDWAERSQAALGPVRVGNIVVTPKRLRESFPRETTPGVVSITITPSMGFGTGHHASTRLCLALLQRAPVAGARVLDVGTGSGVLAIAASKLGARDVIATDVDPDALQSAAENIEQNDAVSSVRLVEADLARLPDAQLRAASFDLMFANLTGAMLARYADILAKLLSPGGRLIASGFQPEDDAMVTASFAVAGLRLVDRLDEDTWIGAAFARGGA